MKKNKVKSQIIFIRHVAENYKLRATCKGPQQANNEKSINQGNNFGVTVTRASEDL